MFKTMIRTLAVIVTVCIVSTGVLFSQVAILSEFSGAGQPLAVAVDLERNSVIAVKINNSHRIIKYNPFGDILAEWFIDDEPRGIAIDQLNNINVIAVTIDGNHRVVSYSPFGDFIYESFGGGEPVGIAASSGASFEGNFLSIVIMNGSDHRVLNYSAD